MDLNVGSHVIDTKNRSHLCGTITCIHYDGRVDISFPKKNRKRVSTEHLINVDDELFIKSERKKIENIIYYLSEGDLELAEKTMSTTVFYDWPYKSFKNLIRNFKKGSENKIKQDKETKKHIENLTKAGFGNEVNKSLKVFSFPYLDKAIKKSILRQSLYQIGFDNYLDESLMRARLYNDAVFIWESETKKLAVIDFLSEFDINCLKSKGYSIYFLDDIYASLPVSFLKDLYEIKREKNYSKYSSDELVASRVEKNDSYEISSIPENLVDHFNNHS